MIMRSLAILLLLVPGLVGPARAMDSNLGDHQPSNPVEAALVGQAIKLLEAYNNHNGSAILALHAEGAKIFARRGNQPVIATKAEYSELIKQQMVRSKKLNCRTAFGVPLRSVIRGDRAVLILPREVLCTQTGFSDTTPLKLGFRKVGGVWLITHNLPHRR